MDDDEIDPFASLDENLEGMGGFAVQLEHTTTLIYPQTSNTMSLEIEMSVCIRKPKILSAVSRQSNLMMFC